MMRRDVWHVRDEMSVVSPGLGGLWDGSRTEGRTSHSTEATLVISSRVSVT